MNKKIESKRKNFLINPYFQIQFILVLMIFSVFSCGFMYLSQRYFFSHYMNRATLMGLPGDHEFLQFLRLQNAFMNNIFLGTALFILVFGTIFGLLYSFRIAGPLYHLKKVLDGIIETNPDRPVTFRKNDYFKEIASSFNNYISKRGEK